MHTPLSSSVQASPTLRQSAVRILLDLLFLAVFFGLLSLPMLAK